MLAGSLGWAGLIFEIIYFYVLNKNVPSVSLIEIAIVFALFFFLHYTVFIRNRKYQRIYEQYKTVGSKKGREKLICVAYVFIPFLSDMLIAMVWHKII
jgi:hypothetical protein